MKFKICNSDTTYFIAEGYCERAANLCPWNRAFTLLSYLLAPRQVSQYIDWTDVISSLLLSSQ
jgi:hypothetical protein